MSKFERYLIWVGYMISETDEHREIEYYGKFAKTKFGLLGAAKVMLNNTTPYRILMLDMKPVIQEAKSMNMTLNQEDWFTPREQMIPS